MSEYHPDSWVIVEINSAEHEVIHKVLAGWYGGFAGSNSWKLSSGIVSIAESGELVTMPQSSGSTYVCHKGDERMSGMMSMVLGSFVEKADAGGWTIKQISLEELKDKLTK